MNGTGIYRIAVLTAGLVIMAACSSPTGEDHAGGGNRSPNAYGYAMVEDGSVPLAGAKVSLYNISIGTDELKSYSWDLIDTTLTGADGFFQIASDDSTLVLDQLAVVIEKDHYRAFSGYHDFIIDSLSFDTVAVAKGKRVAGTFQYAPRITDMQLTVGTDTVYPFDTLAVTIGLVGTPYSGKVQEDSTFSFEYLPASSYKMEMVYQSVKLDLGTLDQMTLVGYTPFYTDLENLEEFDGEPYVYTSTYYFMQNDTVVVHSRDFIMRYYIEDLP